MVQRLVTDQIWREALHRLRSVNSAELSARIARLRRADFNIMTEAQIRERLGRLMDGYSTKTVSLVTNQIYRARKNNGNQSFENTTELWYPPAAVVQPGRFNRAGQSVFYSSNTMNAALWEIRPAEGDKVTVAICRSVERVLAITCVHIGLYLYQGKAPAVGGVPDLRSDTHFITGLQTEKVDRKWTKIDALLAELVTGDEKTRPNLYAATRQIGTTLLGVGTAEGLIYPSVAAGLAAFNLRLEPSVADEKLTIGEVWEFEIIKHIDHLEGRPRSKPGYVLTRPVRRSEKINSDGSIQWMDRFERGAAIDFSTIQGRLDSIRK